MKSGETWSAYEEREAQVDARQAVEAGLREIEAKYDVTILLAADTGSRTCNLHSFGSDYDVHFVFRHNHPRSYLGLAPPRDSLDHVAFLHLPPSPGSAEPQPIELNYSGWDLKKACALLLESNVSMVDLLFLSQSPSHGYRSEGNPFLAQLPSLTFNFRRMGLHNRSVASGVLKAKLQEKGPKEETKGTRETKETREVPVKAYLNLLRYVNLGEQCRKAMQESGAECNPYVTMNPLDYSLLPPSLQNFQRLMISERRSHRWQTPRHLDMEEQASELMERQRTFFHHFEAQSQEAARQDKVARETLSSAAHQICFEVLFGAVQQFSGAL